MRTIFITPLLWKKIDRAMRRRSEGQALVLVALTAIGMVAIVGLAIDGGLGFLDVQRVQRAADAAALAGAIWIPDRLDVANARGLLATQANGFDAVNHPAVPVPRPSNQQPYNVICDTNNRNSAISVIMSDASNSDYSQIYFCGQATGATQYQAFVGHRSHRWFLGIIGIPDFYVERAATAAYTQLPRLGAANNYFGSNGLLEDHDRMDINGINSALRGLNYPTCDKNNPSSWQGNAGDDPKTAYVHYYCGMYLRYATNSCAFNATTNNGNGNGNNSQACLGTFWLGMYGTGNYHANGDAYNPAGDGGSAFNGNSGLIPNSSEIGTSTSNGCYLQPSDTETWYFKFASDSTNCASNINTDNYPNKTPQVNFQYHPDAPIDPATAQPARGFGYEVAIQVDPNALKDNGPSDHTALNVSIWNAAFTDSGLSQTYLNNTTYSGNRNAAHDITNLPTSGFANDFDSVSRNAYGIGAYGPQTTAQANPSTSAEQVVNKSVNYFPASNTTAKAHIPADNLNFSRYMLFLPPAAAGTPTTWATKGAPVHAINGSQVSANNFTTDYNSQIGSALIGVNLSYTNEDYTFALDNNLGMPITYTFGANGAPQNSNQTGAFAGDTTDYNDQINYVNGQPDSVTTGYWRNFCYIVNPGWLNTSGAVKIQDTYTAESYFYVCPTRQGATTNGSDGYPNSSSTSTVSGDRYWNQLYGSPSASHFSLSNGSTIGGFGYFNGTAYSTVITGSAAMYITGTYGVQNDESTAFSSTSDLNHTVDIHQACRPIYDTLWGNDRIPINMRGSDWTSVIQSTGSTARNISGDTYITKSLTTNYYSYHGQRCSWDFDSTQFNSTQGPDFNPSNGLALKGCGYPGSSSNDATKLLDTPDKTSFAALDTSLDQGNGHALDNISCYEPYFHISNYHWENGTRTRNSVTTNDNNSFHTIDWLVGGTYMLHIQTMGGAGFHTYSVKAEYEHPNTVNQTITGGSSLQNRYPVPNVFALNSMTLFANIEAQGTNASSVLFDLANIPSSNASYTAVLELWDPGDPFSTNNNPTVNVQILQPSGYGRGYSYPTSSGSYSTDPTAPNGLLNSDIASRVITIQNLRVYPYNNTIKNASVSSPSGLTYSSINPTNHGDAKVNDQWVYMAFQLPDSSSYNAIQTSCASHGVPDDDCYYFQIKYNVSGLGGSKSLTYADDLTTWELYIQSQPVHLVK